MTDTARPLPPRDDRLARAIALPFHRLLDRIDAGLAAGAIEADLPDGTHRRLGGRAAGPVAHVVIHRWRALVRLATGGSIGWYDGWEAGDWASPDPVPLFDLFMRNRRTLGSSARAGGPTRLLARIGHALRRNDPRGARRNIAAHYDLGNAFYAEWLDPSLTYSSALFESADDGLEAAQRRKLAAILERTGVQLGGTLLEIGSGWGSFAATASAAGANVHTITLSEEQKRHVDALALPNVRCTLTDYRHVLGTYDAVASIEMVEAVGQEFWPDYLNAIARMLRPGGRAAIQFISIDDAIFDAYASNVDFIQRYVFPGGMLIARDRFAALAERAGLDWRDEHRFGQDYARTLRLWRERFEAAVREGRLPAGFDARFVRLWRYYLMYCEGGFSGGGIDVHQVTLVRR
ncbi:class I SAM-dependent methyltransferase [Sphingomonas sp.]|uniref:class I SAM-dependent methyltransferase n=1 Tax=Sphingomonas sp. TaxID=28214 RepID=UPI0035C7E5EE